MMKRFLSFSILLALLPFHRALSQQGRIDTGITEGVKAARVAIPLLQSTSGGDKSGQLTQLFNQVLWDDLEYTGNLVLISRSFYPLGTFANPGDIRVEDWKKPEVNAEFIVFGSTATNGNQFTVEARLWDLKLPQNQEMLGNRYREQDSEAAVRVIAHRL